MTRFTQTAETGRERPGDGCLCAGLCERRDSRSHCTPPRIRPLAPVSGPFSGGKIRVLATPGVHAPETGFRGVHLNPHPLSRAVKSARSHPRAAGSHAGGREAGFVPRDARERAGETAFPRFTIVIVKHKGDPRLSTPCGHNRRTAAGYVSGSFMSPCAVVGGTTPSQGVQDPTAGQVPRMRCSGPRTRRKARTAR